MTREEALAMYHPIRAAMRRILSSAISVSNHSDLMRAAKQLGLWADGKIVLTEGDEAGEMLSDIALFESNQRGRRAFDVFLATKAGQLEAVDFELAQRMGDAFFPLFRFSMRHEVAGVWLEDLLAGNRRLWLMDESMEASASKDIAFGMRVFDAGAFHVGFGIAVRRMTRRPSSRFRAWRAMAAPRSATRSPLLCTAIAFAAARRFPRSWKTRADSRRVFGARPTSQETRKRKH